MIRNVAFLAIALIAFASVANAQVDTTQDLVKKQPTAKDVKKVEEPAKVMLDADGKFVGHVVAKVGKEDKPVSAVMTLIRGGVKVKTVRADEKGNFSFGNVPPGKYSVTGAAAEYVGASPVLAVEPVQGVQVGPGTNSFVLAAPSYQSSTPAVSYAPSAGGGGGGFVGGGAAGGRRRLLRLGLIGGIVAIAVSGDDDASPDN
ncbi:MAG: hypothetical protein AAFN77_11830 [Planctomycetota bacterium]